MSTDYSDFSDEELVEEHGRALRLQRQAASRERPAEAEDKTRARLEMWKEARERGIDGQL